MHDAVQRVECRLIAHHLAAQRRTVERPVRGEDVGAEATHDGGEHLPAGRLGLPRERVGVDDRRAPAPQMIDHRGLARGDIAREGDTQHCNPGAAPPEPTGGPPAGPSLAPPAAPPQPPPPSPPPPPPLLPPPP